MGKSLAKVIFKPDPNASDVYIVVVNHAEYKKWKDGDKTIPLADVVDAFDIFSSNQGPQGLLRRPSRQELDTVFNTHVDDKVIAHILENGKEEASESLTSGKGGSKNDSRGSAFLDSRGGTRTTGI